MVALFFRFVGMDSGEDIELEEFSVSFFDFDQDYADGDKAYVRESLIIADWATCFVENTTQLEMAFTTVPVRIVTSMDIDTHGPSEWANIMRQGVIVRSTEQGSSCAGKVRVGVMSGRVSSDASVQCSTADDRQFTSQCNLLERMWIQ